MRDRIEIGLRDASVFLVAIDADGMVGAAELRRRPSGMFLNHIVVAQGHQGRGVGGNLLRFGAEALNLTSGDLVTLDVFEDNAAAIAWYGQLGMTIIDERRLFRLGPTHGDSDAWRVDDFVQCGALIEKYGFGSCRIVTKVRDYSVGVLDSGVVRTKGIAGDEAGLGALTHLWPESILLSEEVSPSEVLEEHARTLRMRGSALGLLDITGGQ